MGSEFHAFRMILDGGRERCDTGCCKKNEKYFLSLEKYNNHKIPLYP